MNNDNVRVSRVDGHGAGWRRM